MSSYNTIQVSYECFRVQPSLKLKSPCMQPTSGASRVIGYVCIAKNFYGRVRRRARGRFRRVLLALGLLKPGPVGAVAEPGCIKNLVAVTSPNLNEALEGTAIRQIALRAPLGGVRGLSTKAARAAHAGPRAAAVKMASSRCTRTLYPAKPRSGPGPQWPR
jgi:hypothetical protein